MPEFMIKARTIATAAITWITIAGLVLTAVAQTLTTAAFDAAVDRDVVELVVRWVTIASGVLATIAQVVRRVTEVIPEQRGLTPVDAPTPVKHPAP
jgi:hypothetical protein